MEDKDRRWVNTRDRYYTLKPGRKNLYIDELQVEKDTGMPAAIHLMFPSDKIKEEFLYSEQDPIGSLMNGIIDPCVLGVVKNTQGSFFLLVHPMPTHAGWHDGRFVNTHFDIIRSSKELVFMKGKDIMQSVSEDSTKDRVLYKKLNAMGDCMSVSKKHEVFLELSKHVSRDVAMDLALMLRALPLDSTASNIVKGMLLDVKKYMSRHKDFDFEAQLERVFVSMYENSPKMAAYVAKHLKRELKSMSGAKI